MPRRYKYRLVEEESSSLIQDTSKRLSTSVDLMMTQDNIIPRLFDKTYLSLNEIQEKEEQDQQPPGVEVTTTTK